MPLHENNNEKISRATQINSVFPKTGTYLNIFFCEREQTPSTYPAAETETRRERERERESGRIAKE
jgi:hypothetical protein